MSGMTKIEGPLDGPHLDGIRFSMFSIPHVPTALVYGNTAFLEPRPFQSNPAQAVQFIHRTCPGPMRFWTNIPSLGGCALEADAFGFEFTIPNMKGNSADQMSFRMKTIYPTGKPTLLRAEIEYRSSAFYLFQFAEFPLGIAKPGFNSDEGVAATMIAGGAALFSDVAGKYNILRRLPNVAMEDAKTIAESIANSTAKSAEKKTMSLNALTRAYESESRRYGHACNKLTIDDAPVISVKYSLEDTRISTLHGHNLRGPSIAILQNIRFSIHEVLDEVEPIIVDLIHAAQGLCPTLPLVQA